MRINKYIIFVAVAIFSSCFPGKPVSKMTTGSKENTIIAASQAGAMPVFFDPDDPHTQLITPGNFHDSRECFVRGGLPNFFHKAETGKAVTIGYIGGSITHGDGMYRNQSAKFICRMFPLVRMRGVNAGISGTGTDLGACRIRDQLLKYHPDLIFIEFAVNGAFKPGMEGMIRQIWKFDPYIDICLLYTIRTGQSKIYAAGCIPENIRGLEEIAGYYHIPSVHMAMEASTLEMSGKLLWKGSPDSLTQQIIFSRDGIHPLEAGGNLYAKAVARAMKKMKIDIHPPAAHPLPSPLLSDNWEDARMLDPGKSAEFSADWKVVDPLKKDSLRTFAPWFPYVMKSGDIGASFTFLFKGTMVGIFDIGGPESGQLLLTVDGQKKKLINRFNRYCNNRYRGQCAFATVDEGVHKVTFSISSKKANKRRILGPDQLEDISKQPERYNQTVELLGKILIRGELVSPRH